MARNFSFPHRENRDGTWDSICPRCFRTVATATDPLKLEAEEIAHDCDPDEIYRLYHSEKWQPTDLSQ